MGRLGGPPRWVLAALAAAACTGQLPGVQIDEGPPAWSRATSATFLFKAKAEGAASYACRLDDAPAVPCAPPYTVEDLDERAHAFEVFVFDGTEQGLPARHAWNVDLTAPGKVALSGPAKYTGAAQAAFTAVASEPSTFAYRLDGAEAQTAGAEAAPEGKWQIDGLAEGAHALDAWAVDRAGNAGEKASHAWTVDRTPPTVTVTGPSADSTFELACNEPPCTFECRVNDGTWASCTSPASFGGLTVGANALEVRATDRAGNTGDAVRKEFTVGPSPVRFTSGPGAFTQETHVEIAFEAVDPGRASSFEARYEPPAGDPVDWAASASPWIGSALAEGAHTLKVRAKYQPASGPELTGPEAAYAFTVDVTAPEITVSGPTETDQVAEFTISGNEPIEACLCRIDDADFASCSSPYAAGAEPGFHTGEVHCQDRAGNPSETVSWEWVQQGTLAVAGESELTLPALAPTEGYIGNDSPDLVWTGSLYAATWVLHAISGAGVRNDRLLLAPIDEDGFPLADAYPPGASASGGTISQPSLALGSVVLGWTRTALNVGGWDSSTTDGSPQLYYQRLDAATLEATAAIKTWGRAGAVLASGGSGGVAMAWREPPTTVLGWELALALPVSGGDPGSTYIKVASSVSTSGIVDLVASPDGGYALAWTSAGKLFTGAVSAEAHVSGPHEVAATPVAGPVLAAGSGQVGLAWVTGNQALFVLLGAYGAPLGTPVSLGIAATRTPVALARVADAWAAAWVAEVFGKSYLRVVWFIARASATETTVFHLAPKVDTEVQEDVTVKGLALGGRGAQGDFLAVWTGDGPGPVAGVQRLRGE